MLLPLVCSSYLIDAIPPPYTCPARLPARIARHLRVRRVHQYPSRPLISSSPRRPQTPAPRATRSASNRGAHPPVYCGSGSSCFCSGVARSVVRFSWRRNRHRPARSVRSSTRPTRSAPRVPVARFVWAGPTRPSPVRQVLVLHVCLRFVCHSSRLHRHVFRVWMASNLHHYVHANGHGYVPVR